MNSPLFSIIIPTYNSQKTLVDCLKSIVLQDYINYEIWLIDGSSNDETLSIISEFALKNPSIYHITEPDEGIYDAMNKGIGLAKGEWLYFLGSDDTFYDKDVLTKIAKEICRSKSDVVYGNVLMRGKNQWNLDGNIFAGEFNLERILSMSICHQAIFYNKKVFEKYGKFSLRYSVASDYEFNLRCYAQKPFYYANIIVANFYVGGHSTKSQDQFNADKGAIFMKYFRMRIYTKSFINSRFYLQIAALSSNSTLNIKERLFCLFAYIKLKVQSILNVYLNKMLKMFLIKPMKCL